MHAQLPEYSGGVRVHLGLPGGPLVHRRAELLQGTESLAAAVARRPAGGVALQRGRLPGSGAGWLPQSTCHPSLCKKAPPSPASLCFPPRGFLLPFPLAVLPSGHLSVFLAALVHKGLHFCIIVIKAWEQFHVLVSSFAVISQGIFLCDGAVLMIIILVASCSFSSAYALI